jgi:hypothetical protein
MAFLRGLKHPCGVLASEGVAVMVPYRILSISITTFMNTCSTNEVSYLFSSITDTVLGYVQSLARTCD